MSVFLEIGRFPDDVNQYIYGYIWKILFIVQNDFFEESFFFSFRQMKYIFVENINGTHEHKPLLGPFYYIFIQNLQCIHLLGVFLGRRLFSVLSKPRCETRKQRRTVEHMLARQLL